MEKLVAMLPRRTLSQMTRTTHSPLETSLDCALVDKVSRPAVHVHARDSSSPRKHASHNPRTLLILKVSRMCVSQLQQSRGTSLHCCLLRLSHPRSTDGRSPSPRPRRTLRA